MSAAGPRRPSPPTHGLWSLWDMMIFWARPLVQLGEEIHSVRALFIFKDDKPLDAEEIDEVQTHFTNLLNLCDNLDLPTSKTLIEGAKADLPRTSREFEILISALYAEAKNKLLAFIPHHREKYFRPVKFIAASIADKFPSARAEIREAGKCFVFERYTATVLHSVRAVEIGLKAMASALGVTLSFPLEQAQQEDLIRGIQAKINALIQQQKSAEKDADLTFYSEAAMEFRYFKDGWRVRAAHARATYDEDQARRILEHTVTLFEILSKRLSEPSVSEAQSA